MLIILLISLCFSSASVFSIERKNVHSNTAKMFKQDIARSMPLVVKNNKSKKQAKVSSKTQAAKLAKNRFSAKVLSVNKIKQKGNTVYRVKLLSSKGVVFFALVDAQTGQVSRK